MVGCVCVWEVAEGGRGGGQRRSKRTEDAEGLEAGGREGEGAGERNERGRK